MGFPSNMFPIQSAYLSLKQGLDRFWGLGIFVENTMYKTAIGNMLQKFKSNEIALRNTSLIRKIFHLMQCQKMSFVHCLWKESKWLLLSILRQKSRIVEIRVTIIHLSIKQWPKKKKKAKQTYWLHWALICRSGLNCPDGRIELNIRRKTLMFLDNIAWMVLKCDYVNRRTPLSQSALPLLSSSLIQPDIWQLADTSSQETEPDIWFE